MTGEKSCFSCKWCRRSITDMLMGVGMDSVCTHPDAYIIVGGHRDRITGATSAQRMMRQSCNYARMYLYPCGPNARNWERRVSLWERVFGPAESRPTQPSAKPQRAVADSRLWTG